MIVVAIIGILAAIAVPNFIRFSARSKQSEAKMNLRAVFLGQKAVYGDKDAYSVSMGDLGFAPERGNRYTYDLGNEGTPPVTAAAAGLVYVCVVMATRVGPNETPGSCGVRVDVFRYSAGIIPTTSTNRSTVTWVPTIAGNLAIPPDNIGVQGAVCPNCDFAAHAIGNVDNDPGADEWFVSSQAGSVAPGPCAESFVGVQPGNAVVVHNDVNCEQ